MASLLQSNKYILLFASLFCVFSLLVFVYKRTDIFPWIGGCNWRGYDAEHYMAYCHSQRYGDYEHLAFWYESEPEIIDNLKKAKVLFLGNSRTQYAFSTNSVDSFFEKNGINHYVFGFGMNSQNIVPEKMIRRYTLNPKLLVINADPFFTNRSSKTNRIMLATTWLVEWEVLIKKWQQKLQREICSSSERRYIKWLVCGSGKVLYRSRENGHWVTKYFHKNKRIPVGESDRYLETIDQAVDIGKDFIKQLDLDKSCVVITATPQVRTPLKYATALSQRLGIKAIFPNVDGLLTIDKSHLDSESAERWSSIFLQQILPVVDRCVNGRLVDDKKIL